MVIIEKNKMDSTMKEKKRVEKLSDNIPALYVSLFHNFIVLSFSSAADAIMFSVGWHAVHRTISVWP